MDWNKYAQDIRQADQNVQRVVSGGHIMLDRLNFTNTRHAGEERTGRSSAVNQEGGGFGKEVLAVYYVDRNHPNGPELHWITDNAIVLITNALRGNGLDVCTHIPARPGQLKRYPTGDNPSFYACEQMFPDKDWRVPSWLLNIAQEHQRLGLNMREESTKVNENYQLGDLLQDRQEIAWDYVMYYADKRTLNAIKSDSKLEEKVKEAVYDAVAKEVPDVKDDDDDFTKSCRVGMDAALQTCMEYNGKMATESFGEVKEGTETNPRFKCMESEQSDPLYVCPFCGNDDVYGDSQSQDDRNIYLSNISDGGKFRVERHCSKCDHYWDVVMKTIVDHIDGDWDI